MPYLLLSDLVVVIHFAFVIFVIAGGLLLFLRWWLAFAHLPAFVWGALVEFTHWICPLTYLEDALREQAGLAAYRGDFVTHYLMPILYPAHLTANIQLLLGSLVTGINIVIYTALLWHWHKIKRAPSRTR
ncbi:MAG: DUF2784 domain-containing protein [Gammaproteobacteria bacterium]|nr:DUF2784 family protein [Gammaproteobacteria bacterium]MBU6509579.1 DUF2784 family protein [Gammaproteobacteria bacterium]MDE1983436.1 DUF2784 domain-containing protein [Gammaproteobacteria bacterium]MDE2109441.1 DUF2784 domain-containing protein [Gammaproteobacteria bacterium]MDE2460392.1 DUF2784 domain-containing protein [Gammaproteobacteria bacterium]